MNLLEYLLILNYTNGKRNLVWKPQFQSKDLEMLFTLKGPKLIVYRNLFIPNFPELCSISKLET